MPIVIDYSLDTTPISAGAIINRCGVLLLDKEHDRWGQPAHRSRRDGMILLTSRSIAWLSPNMPAPSGFFYV